MTSIHSRSEFGGEGAATIDADDLASYVGGRWHAEEGDEGGHLLRRAEAAHGHPRHLHLGEPPQPGGVAQCGAEHAGVDGSRRDAVDAHAVRRPLGGEAPGERVQGALADRVGGQRRVRDEGGDGGHVHHRGAAVRSPEERVGEAGQVEARVEVGGHEVGVVAGRGVRGRLVDGLAGVVDEDVELAPEEASHRADEALHVALRGHVADGAGDGVGGKAPVGPAAPACGEVAGGAAAGVHPGAMAGQLLHDRKPDPSGSSGDERRLAGQAPL